jgi:hypothetical protein
MSTVEVEVTPLEGVDLDGAPPCMMTGNWHLLGLARFIGLARLRVCKRPSTHRVRMVCPVHGERLVFLCAWHVKVAKLGLAICRACERDGSARSMGYAGES